MMRNNIAFIIVVLYCFVGCDDAGKENKQDVFIDKRENENVLTPSIVVINKPETNYTSCWQLHKIKLAWLDKDSIISSGNEILKFSKDSLFKYEGKTLVDKAKYSLTENIENELGEFLLNTDESKYYSMTKNNDTLFIYQDSYDSNVYMYKKIMVCN